MVSIEEIKAILSKEISIKRKEKISVEDLRSLNELLRSGLSIKNSLSLLTTRSNEKAFNEILKGLDSGKLVEEMVTDKLPAGISEYLRP